MISTRQGSAAWRSGARRRRKGRFMVRRVRDITADGGEELARLCCFAERRAVRKIGGGFGNG
jgi:hypothetical protein